MVLALAVGAAVNPVVTPAIFREVQARPGWSPPDPLLPVLGPASVGALISPLLITTVVLVVAGCLHRPLVLVRGVLALVVLFTLRMITMMVAPLDAPPGLIAWRDPVGQLFYPRNVPMTRDLFFSGHTATLVLLVALVRSRPAKIAVAAAAAAMGALLLVQHAHWTVDVLAAPLFAALAWRLSGFFAVGVPGPGRSRGSTSARSVSQNCGGSCEPSQVE